MSKKTLLVVSDAAVAPTGFGRVAEAVLDRLHETGKWNIKQLGINYFDEDHDKPYRIFAATGAGNYGDWAGYRRIKPLYEEIKPDVTWLFQDFWHIAHYLTAVPEIERVVTYFPVDSPNIKSIWAVPQAYAEEVCTYTRFGAEELSKSMQFVANKIKMTAIAEDKTMVKKVNLQGTGSEVLSVPAAKVKHLLDPNNINVIPHGNNLNVFYPVDRNLCRSLFTMDPDWFVVGNVNRNQSRKRLDLTVRAFAEFAKDKDDVRLLMHDPLKTHEGWDLRQLVEECYQVSDKVLLSNENLTVKKLNQLYNTIDVMVNTGGGEGFGLCSSESASCRVAQIVPNWSATAEIWGGVGVLLDVVSVRHEDGRINTMQAVIDTDHLVRELNALYEDRKKLQDMSEACYQNMMNEDYDWDNIVAKFDKIFEEVSERPPREYPEVPTSSL